VTSETGHVPGTFDVITDFTRRRATKPMSARRILTSSLPADATIDGGFSSFPTQSLLRRYPLRWRDFKARAQNAGERSGEGMIGPHFQLLLDAEDATARMFGQEVTTEVCHLVRDIDQIRQDQRLKFVCRRRRPADAFLAARGVKALPRKARGWRQPGRLTGLKRPELILRFPPLYVYGEIYSQLLFLHFWWPLYR
jgi:hypothetical protein